jgi:hypothetical protein
MRSVVIVAIVGCAVPPPAQAPVAEMPMFPQPFTFSPDGEPLRYGESLPAPATTPFDDAVIAATKTTPDPRLFRACAALASIHDRLDPEAVKLAWSWNGVIEPPARPLVIRTDDPQEIVAALGAIAPGTHIGIGHIADFVIVAVTVPRVVTKPFARAMPVDRGFTIDGQLQSAASHPQIRIDWGPGRAEDRITPAVERGAFQALIPCRGETGHGVVSIVGHDGSTDRVLARFPVWCGIEPTRGLTLDPLHDPTGDDDAERAAHRLFTLLQRERVTFGVPALAWDDTSAAAARQHASTLRDKLEHGGDGPAFQHASIAAASVDENMAVASSIDDAFAKLLAQRERRELELSPAMTAGGVGVALGDDGRVYVSQIFLRVTPVIETEIVEHALEQRIHAANHKIKADWDLRAIAHQIAHGIVTGRDDAKLAGMMLEARERVKDRYVHLFTAVSTITDLPGLDPLSLVTVPKTDRIGIAVLQGRHTVLGDNAISIIIVMGFLGKP